MREDRKKRQEETYLRRFRENFAGFPEGAILPNEHPDFLVETRRGRVGVEITEYHVREPSEGRGSPMRAREATEDEVLAVAAEPVPVEGLASRGGQRPVASPSGVGPPQDTGTRWPVGRSRCRRTFLSRIAASPIRQSHQTCGAIFATGGGFPNRHPPGEHHEGLVDVRASGVCAHHRTPGSPGDIAGQGSEGVLVPAALPGGVAPHRRPWPRTVNVRRPRAGDRRTPV